MDRLDAMRVLVAAVDQGSLVGAARTLQRSPAAVSRAVAFLERQVGAPLLHRSTRAVRLSAVGEGYASACRRILADLEDAELRALEEHAAPRGLLTLSAPCTAAEEILRPIVEAFLQAHPSMRVRLRLEDDDVSLIDEGVDVALRVGALPDSSLTAIKVGAQVRRVIAASPAYLARHTRITQPSDLVRHQIIALAASGGQTWTFPPAAGSLALRTVSFTPRLMVSSVRAVLASAVEDLGVTRLYSYQVAERVRDGGLQIVLSEAEPAPLRVHLLAPPQRTSAPKVRAFLDLATPRLRAAFARLALPTEPAGARGLAA